MNESTSASSRAAGDAIEFQGEEERLGQAVALALRTLKDGIPYTLIPFSSQRIKGFQNNMLSTISR